MVSIILINFKPPSFFISWLVLIHTSILPLHLLSPPSSEHHVLFLSKHHSHPASSPGLTVIFQQASLIFLSYLFTTQKGATLLYEETSKLSQLGLT